MKRAEFLLAAVAAVAIVSVLASPARAASSQAASGIAGRLSNIEGRVEVQRGKSPPRRVTLPALVRVDDVVTLHAGASAELYLRAADARYRLASGSRVRVEARALRPLSGPVPQRRDRSARMRAASLPANLFDERLLGIVTRGGLDEDLGPRNPSPRFAVRRAPVTLRWDGPLDPAVVARGEAVLHVRLTPLGSEKIVLERDLPPAARRFAVPAGMIEPGRWYRWSVRLVGGAERCGGPLRLLTPGERAELARVEREADALRQTEPASPVPDLLRAEAYECLGLLPDALDMYRSALRFAPGAEAQEGADRLGKLLGGN